MHASKLFSCRSRVIRSLGVLSSVEVFSDESVVKCYSRTNLPQKSIDMDSTATGKLTDQSAENFYPFQLMDPTANVCIGCYHELLLVACDSSCDIDLCTGYKTCVQVCRFLAMKIQLMFCLAKCESVRGLPCVQSSRRSL